MDLSIPKVMGILNITPDSFFDGGHYFSEKALLEQAEKMLTEGADLIDVGGYSSRPGATEISVEEELSRTVTAIAAINRQFPGTIISVDTFRSSVAEAAVQAGACLVNDISGGNLDPEMFRTISRLKVPYVLMHMRGDPATMSTQTQYGNLIGEMLSYFHAKLHALRQFEVSDVLIDPGFGFSKTREQGFVLLQNLEKFSILGKPMLVGLSRKSMIWRTLNLQAADALNGTTALNTIAILKGASMLRVHDVKEAREIITLITELPAG